MIAYTQNNKIIRVELESWGEAVSFEVDYSFEQELKETSWYKIFGGCYVCVGNLDPATVRVVYAVLPYGYFLLAREVYRHRVLRPILRWLWKKDLLDHERGNVIPWHWAFTRVRYSKLLWLDLK